MSQAYFNKFLELLEDRSTIYLKDIFVWQVFDRSGLPMTEPHGPLQVSDEMIYIFHRIIDIRDKIPNYAINIQFLKDKFIVGVGEPANLSQLFKEIDKISQIPSDPPPSAIPYKIFTYEDVLQSENEEFPGDIDLKLILREAHQIDKACPRVYELFIGNIQKLAFIGMRHSTQEKQYSIITSSGGKLFLVGMVQSDNLGGMYYLVQDFHPVLEKY